MPVSSTASSGFSQRDLQLLVDMVRLSRVTLLLAESGSEKSEFLRSSVMPLLNEKKRGSPGGEIGILFDEWDKPPLPALQARIRQAVGAAGVAVPPPGSGSLVENLEAWQDAITDTFLIVLDRFEDFLRAPREASATAEFETAFVHIANDPTLRVNFLLALDQDAEPLLANLRRHIPRLGYSSVRLPARTVAAPPTTSREPMQEPRPSMRSARSAQREAREASVNTEPSPTVSVNVIPLATAPASAAPEAEAREIPSELVTPTQEPPTTVEQMPQPVPEVSEPRREEDDRAAAMPEPAMPKVAAPQSRRASPAMWVVGFVVAAAVGYFFWQPRVEPTAQLVPASPADVSASKPAPEGSPPAADTPAAEVSARVAEPAAAEAVAPKSDAAANTGGAERKAEIAPAKSESKTTALAAAPETRDVRGSETAAPKVPPTSAAPAPRTETREIRKAEPAAAKAPQAVAKPAMDEATKPPAPLRGPPVAAAPPPAQATAPGQRASGEAAPGPVLRINVRTEAQRARAKQLIAPLRERGIHVASIRLVPAHGDAAHIRYHRSAERAEAMRLAAALTELGLGARQLRQVDETSSSAPARQYELWLATE